VVGSPRCCTIHVTPSLDVTAATIFIRPEQRTHARTSSRKTRQNVVETNGQALVECLRMIPGQRHVCIEEGTQSAWLYEILAPHAQQMVVAT